MRIQCENCACVFEATEQHLWWDEDDPVISCPNCDALINVEFLDSFQVKED